MGMSVRSHLVAVTATIVVTGAVAVTPVQRLPAIAMPPTAMVTLAGFVSPLSEVFGTLSLASTYLFSPADPTSADAWPSAQFGTYWGDPPVAYPVLPEILSEAALGGYSAVGLIPQIINDGLPALRQLGINASDYLDTVVNAAATAGIAISQGVWNLPSAVITATQEALSGDVAGALATLSAAIRGPITTAGTALLAAGTYVLTGVTTRAAAVLAGLTSERAYGLAVGGVPLLIRTVVDIATTTVADLADLNIEGAWNTAVAGLLGPSGLQGMGLNITIGAGVQTGQLHTGYPHSGSDECEDRGLRPGGPKPSATGRAAGCGSECGPFCVGGVRTAEQAQGVPHDRPNAAHISVGLPPSDPTKQPKTSRRPISELSYLSHAGSWFLAQRAS